MNTPNPDLMSQYGTLDVYEQKLAGRLFFPGLAARAVEEDRARSRQVWEQAIREREERLKKQASSGFAPLSVRMALGLLNLSENRADEARQRALVAKAQEMNQALAQVRAMMMYPAERNMQHTHVPIALSASHYGPRMLSDEDIPLGYDEGMVRMASAMGEALAHLDADALEKDAGIFGTIGNAAQAAAKAIPKAMGTFGKTFNKVRSGALDAVGADKGILSATSRALGSAKSTLQSQFKGDFRPNQARMKALESVNPALRSRFEAAQKAKGLDPMRATQTAQKPLGTVQPPTNPAQMRQQGLAQAASMTPEQKAQARINRRMNDPQPGGRVQTPQQAPGAQPPKGGQPNIQQPQPATEPTTNGVQPPQPLPQAQPAAPGAPAAQGPASAGKVGPPTQGEQFNLGDKLEQGWKRTGLSDGNWKWKVPLLAGGALAAYGAVQGAKGLAGMMSQESAPYQFNKGSVQPAAGINEYGYADRSTPFSQ